MKKIWILGWMLLVGIGITQAKLSLGALATADLTAERVTPLTKSLAPSVQAANHDPWNDYYDDDDFYYSRRLRRFHPVSARTYGWNYYDPYFVDDVYYVLGTPLWNRFYAPRPYAGFGFNRWRVRSYFWGWRPRASFNFSFGWGGFNSWAYDPYYDFCAPVWNRPAALGWYGGWNSWGWNTWGGNSWGFNRGFRRGYNNGFNNGYYAGYTNAQNYWYRRSGYNHQISGNYSGREAVYANYKRLPNGTVGSRNVRNNPYIVDQYERRGGNRSTLNSRRRSDGTISSRTSRNAVRTPNGVSRSTRTSDARRSTRVYSRNGSELSRRGTISSSSRQRTLPNDRYSRRSSNATSSRSGIPSRRSTPNMSRSSSSSRSSMSRPSSPSRRSTPNMSRSSSSSRSSMSRPSSPSRRSTPNMSRSSSSSRSSMSRPSSSPSRRSTPNMSRSSSSSRSSMSRPSSSSRRSSPNMSRSSSSSRSSMSRPSSSSRRSSPNMSRSSSSSRPSMSRPSSSSRRSSPNMSRSSSSSRSSMSRPSSSSRRSAPSTSRRSAPSRSSGNSRSSSSSRSRSRRGPG